MTNAALPADVFRAISDPTRRRILDVLATGEHAVRDLLSHFDVSQPAISQHLKALKSVGLVRERKEGRFRIYSLDATPLRLVHDWTAHYEQFWNEKLDALGDFLDRTGEE